jgi:hypothetical protein
MTASHAIADTPGAAREMEQTAPAAGGPLVLDIGGRTGALVVHASGVYDGTEIHLCPAGLPGARTHNVVRRRSIPGGLVYAAVFPALDEGEYLVLAPGPRPAPVPVTVAGGRVAEVSLPDPQEHRHRPFDTKANRYEKEK